MSQVLKIIIGASVLNDKAIKEFIEGARLEGYEVETTKDGVIITGDDLGPLLERLKHPLIEATKRNTRPEKAEPPEPEKQPDYIEACKRLAEAARKYMQGFIEVRENIEHSLETIAEHISETHQRNTAETLRKRGREAAQGKQAPRL